MCIKCDNLYKHEKGECLGQEIIDGKNWNIFLCKICGEKFYEKENSSERRESKDKTFFPEIWPYG